ncbi:hypothetical protein CASFOL_005287 [Castilleja foliolosa]|uniref:Uncharacterized protein n=1 Tax=Castilleja foliolosa TaxID=1961234 RepID=A0ABD3E430_9LAMI
MMWHFSASTSPPQPPRHRHLRSSPAKHPTGLNRRLTHHLPRWIKTLFFLITMLISLLLFSAPILLVIADALLPSAFMSAALSPPSPSLNLQTISSHLNRYDFRVYSFCDGPKLSNGLYMGVVAVCSAASLVFVSLKASYVFMNSRYGGYWGYSGGYVRVMVAAMFVSSLGLAIGAEMGFPATVAVGSWAQRRCGWVRFGAEMGFPAVDGELQRRRELQSDDDDVDGELVLMMTWMLRWT